MSNEECGRPATVQFAWGSKINRMCEHHARGVAAVGRAIGMAVTLETYGGPVLCSSHDPHPDDEQGKNNE